VSRTAALRLARPTLLAVVLATAAATMSAASATSAPRVLRVGSWHGQAGQYRSIQAAVDAAKPGDWILVGPGDYHENGDYTTHKPYPAGREAGAGVWIATPGIHLRGMNRNTVIVDGTKPGAPACSSAPGDQLYGPRGSSGRAFGRNGVEIWKADGVSVDNLTACNFLSGSGASGNEIWWNGGDGSGQVGGWDFSGTYLTATTTFYGTQATAAAYGIFSSNWSGGTWDQTYASNFDDSDYYVGACQQVCDQTVNHAWAEYSALGYSGSNSGGTMLVENSQFDNNEDGFDTNSQNGDNPPPQNGACLNNGISPITHTHSCWVFMHNYVHDNNNPNVPSAGSAAAGPVGTGMSLSGGRNDTVMANRFENNGAWGTVFVPYPDNGPPCTGGTLTPAACLYDDSGNSLLDNGYRHNGFFGNPSNADFAETTLEPGPANCYVGNYEEGGGTTTSSPSTLQQTNTTCGGGTTAPDPNPVFTDQIACDSQAISIGPVLGGTVCLPGTTYPRRTRVIMHPLPAGLATMPNPCAGVPANPWCPGTQPVSSVSPASHADAPGLPATGLPAEVPAVGLLLLLSAGLGRRLHRRS